MMRGQFVPLAPQRLLGAGEVHQRADSILHGREIGSGGGRVGGDAHHLWTPERRSCSRRFQQLANPQNGTKSVGAKLADVVSRGSRSVPVTIPKDGSYSYQKDWCAAD